MFSFFRDLLALPIKLLVVVGLYTKRESLVAFQSLVWKITGRIQDGVLSAGYLYRIDPSKAVKNAEQMISQSHSACLSANLIVQDYQIRWNNDWARHWIEFTEIQEFSDDHHLLHPKLMVAQDNDEIKRLSELIMDRNDFAINASSLAYYNMALYHLRLRNLTEAETFINHSLQIEETSNIRIANMALSQMKGIDDMEKQVTYLSTRSPELIKFGRAAAYNIAGNREKAKQWLGQCSQVTINRMILSGEMFDIALEIKAEQETAEGKTTDA